MNQNVNLDTTLAALNRGFNSMPTDEALAILDTWYSQFQSTALGEDLQQVKEAIESGNQTSISIADLLINLGANTATSSSEVGDDEATAAKIQDIAALLNEAGNSLK